MLDLNRKGLDKSYNLKFKLKRQTSWLNISLKTIVNINSSPTGVSLKKQYSANSILGQQHDSNQVEEEEASLKITKMPADEMESRTCATGKSDLLKVNRRGNNSHQHLAELGHVEKLASLIGDVN